MRWLPCLAVPVLLSGLAMPMGAARAQAESRLASLEVQLWPEYDQPSMLVLYDFVISDEIELPALLTFEIPVEANLIAVATRQEDALLNAPFDGPVAQRESQAFTVTVNSQATYRIEYYQPLEINDGRRSFNYIWDGSMAIDKFTIEVLQPPDVTSFSTDPPLQAAPDTGGPLVHASEAVSLRNGQQFSLRLDYDKSSDSLVVPSSVVQPAAPVDAETRGRVSLQQYLPYILGGVGLAVLLGGVIFYALSGRRSAPRRRRRQSQEPDQSQAAGIHCPQCGTRAQAGDHFCRVCGTRLGN